MKYTQEEVENIFLSHGLILKDIYKNNKDPMFCIDKEGYKYMKRINDILRGKGSAPIHSKNPFVLENIDLYLQIHNIDIERLSDKYVDSKTKMKWKCSCGDVFEADWNQIVRGKRFCNFCAKSKRFDGYRDYTAEIKEECDKRNYTLVTEFIKRINDKFDYICDKHADKGVQHLTYDTMIVRGQGCRYCGIESRTEKHKLDEAILKELAESKGYIYVGCDYDNEGTKSRKVNIQVLCPKHIDKGVQRVKYDNLKRNTGQCKYCAGFDRTKEDVQKELDEMGANITILEFTTYAEKAYVQDNQCGHKWWVKCNSLLQGHGCPKCNFSKFEKEAARFLDSHDIHYIQGYTFDDCRDILPLPFDFYLPDYNILIETDGEQHYRPVNFGGLDDESAYDNLLKTQLHDNIKNQYCVDNNITLVRVPYWERKDLNFFLAENVLNLIYD